MDLVTTNHPIPESLNASASAASNLLGNHSSDQLSSTLGQMSGIMLKMPFGHHSRWRERYFVLKDGFLLYYAESEKKTFHQKNCFNMHPKGVIPLRDSSIKLASLAGMPYCISIEHPNIKTQFYIATEDDQSRKAWVVAMEKGAKTTSESDQLGETMIKSLQTQSQQLALEKQEYVDKFIREEEERRREQKLVQELAEFNQQLDEENLRADGVLEELKREYEMVQSKLLEATESGVKLEIERADMAKKITDLKANLEVLSKEKLNIIEQLQEQQSRTASEVERNVKLAIRLAEIEQRVSSFEKEKESTLLMVEQTRQNLFDIFLNKEEINAEIEGLELDMQSLVQEKEMAETQLKEETAVRLETQKEVNHCKEALHRLEAKALSNYTSEKSRNYDATSPTIHDEEVRTDVKSLKRFFENFSEQYQMEIEKPITAEMVTPKSNTYAEASVSSQGCSQKSPPKDLQIRRTGISPLLNKSIVLKDEAGLFRNRDLSSNWRVLLSRKRRSLSRSLRENKDGDHDCA